MKRKYPLDDAIKRWEKAGYVVKDTDDGWLEVSRVTENGKHTQLVVNPRHPKWAANQ